MTRRRSNRPRVVRAAICGCGSRLEAPVAGWTEEEADLALDAHDDVVHAGLSEDDFEALTARFEFGL